MSERSEFITNGTSPSARGGAAVECTAGWYWVKDALADIDLRLAHAKGVRAITTAKVKTDSADAGMLAQLLRTDRVRRACRLRL